MTDFSVGRLFWKPSMHIDKQSDKFAPGNYITWRLFLTYNYATEQFF